MADVGATSSQRDSVKQISPPWLATGFGEKFLYTFGLLDDVLLEKMNQAMRAHMPKYCQVDALPFLGADRVLAQGPFETTASFRIRLQTSFDAWQRAGGRRAVLQQALGFLNGTQGTTSGTVPLGAIVSTSSAGTWATWDTQYNTSNLSKAPAHISIPGANWNWDTNYSWWQAFLVFYFQANSTVSAGSAWGAAGASWGNPLVSWGTNTPANTWTQLRNLIALWKGANTWYPFLVLNFGGSTGVAGSEFSPNSAQGSGNPDGTWATWAKTVNGVSVASRPATDRFVDGPAVFNINVASIPLSG